MARVWEDGVRLDVDGGRSVRVDTWDVCGDHTARNISVGDRVVVFADRDGFGYDATKIVDAAGNQPCAL